METPTDTDAPTGLACVADLCQYPRTCQWNDCCMEAEMKKSLDAKMEAGMQNPGSRAGDNAES